ncbi:CBS domain-containing protein [Streptomyces sp. NBC_00536]|uniref:CBS domain-containing protein n=1 Tax=Streptomyces sp. NBC_00536 TaxID=2975769 RepID=UPI002E800464|nr:CBS domain-containing protein [Streptomyces sp. NBC_00536]WUC77354.1 CBS domain-containing protein [Streptomyces sp. NBC_00536]
MSPNATHLAKPGAKTARDLMTPGAHCVGHDETVLRAARQMAELGVGALPIRDAGDRLIGMITDRDIVVRVLVPGKDPATTPAGELAAGAVTVGADDDAEKILRTMAAHKVRRLPVLDGHRLVGMVAQADVARALPHPEVGALLSALSSD